LYLYPYEQLSKQYNRSIKSGNFHIALQALKRMEHVLRADKMYIDELKILMLIHFIQVRYVGNVSIVTLERAKEACRLSRNYVDSIKYLYYEIIRDDTCPCIGSTVTVDESYELFESYVSGDIQKLKEKLQQVFDKKP